LFRKKGGIKGTPVDGPLPEEKLIGAIGGAADKVAERVKEEAKKNKAIN